MQPAAHRQHFLQVSDPRTPGSDACLGAYFTIDHSGHAPSGYGEHFDPGSGPEITIVSVTTEAGKRVTLDDDAYQAVEAEIVDRFDYRAAEREARDQAAELYCLEGAL